MKPIPGWPGYFASREGRIFSTKARFGKLREIKGWMSPEGYVSVGLSRRKHYVHRVVCLAFHGEPPFPSAHACHNNGIPWDNRADNLRWDSVKGNREDMRRHGTAFWLTDTFKEFARSKRKLSDEAVKEIRRRRKQGISLAKIATEFDVSCDTIYRIVQGETYRDVSDEEGAA
jgi:Helix-turn-helix domain of resolvase/HNH endonuclease